MHLKLYLAVLLFSILSTFSNAQSIEYVEIGINGLHCSACTFSVEKSLRKLDFVRVVSMDLNERNGIVYLEEDSKVDYQALAKAVEEAGFSVRSFELILSESLNKDVNCFDQVICIVNRAKESGTRLKILGKGFMDRKQAKAAAKRIKSSCTSCTTAEQTFRAELL